MSSRIEELVKDININFHKREFSSTRDEHLSKVLSPLQRFGLENLLVELVEEKLGVAVGTENYLYTQEYLRGQIELVKYLLALDDAARADNSNLNV
jgi:hypothetical protein